MLMNYGKRCAIFYHSVCSILPIISIIPTGVSIPLWFPQTDIYVVERQGHAKTDSNFLLVYSQVTESSIRKPRRDVIETAEFSLRRNERRLTTFWY